MTNQEFANEFDILYQNISSNQAPGLNEYEKSVLLTKAQNEIVKNYFTPVQGGNKYQQGMEDSNKRHADFSCIIKVAKAEAANSSLLTIDERGKMFKYPTDMFIPLQETYTVSRTVSVNSTNTTVTEKYQVVPLQMNEYIRLMSKPSTDPLRRQVWRLSGNTETGNGTYEIVPHWKDKNNTGTLTVKYVKKPVPIILEELQEGLTIDGVSTVSQCELAKELHPEILQRAVELAKILYVGQPADVITAGQRSE